MTRSDTYTNNEDCRTTHIFTKRQNEIDFYSKTKWSSNREDKKIINKLKKIPETALDQIPLWKEDRKFRIFRLRMR